MDKNQTKIIFKKINVIKVEITLKIDSIIFNFLRFLSSLFVKTGLLSR